MPCPRSRESADACAALMAKLPSQFPLESDNIACLRTRYLQAERPKPYRVPASSERNAMGKCRKTRLVSSFGWGAFLKDETLRTPEGRVVRVAQGPRPTPTPVFSLPRIRHSDESLLSRDCHVARDASSQDCPMVFLSRSSATTIEGGRGRCGKGSDDGEMPSWETFDSDYSPIDLDMPVAPYWVHGQVHSGGNEDQSCVKAADDMFTMFIDHTCMEVD
ncbi:hypothetical protein K438DRAFT_725478 [Mycena galopus ATCC 62051]|nr:hypothetical protein K438DRAFT_725478 [Mycena galopus ATCC 62051]